MNNSASTLFDDTKQKKKKQVKTNYDNPFEAFEDLGKGILDSAKDNAANSGKDVWGQLFGAKDAATPHMPKAGDLTPGQELDLKNHKDKQKSIEKQANNIRPAIDYVGEILQSHEKGAAKEAGQLKQDIQNLIMEIKNLAGATAALEQQVVEATGNHVVNPGKYHKSFFRWVISVIRDAREKIDNAGTWLSAMKGKQKKGMLGAGKSKKSGMQYWDMAKKHGSQFMLSGERSVSNQTG